MHAIIGGLMSNRNGQPRANISERFFTIKIPREGRFIWVVGNDRDWIFPEASLSGPDASWLGGAFFDEDLCPILSDQYPCAFFLGDPPTNSIEPIHESTASDIIRSWMQEGRDADISDTPA
jgi:hypothetical protein